jgi:ubiquinone/menaquinone biosynthesis C-methylase UbiE
VATSRVLTHDEARRFYDRFGEKQDSQGFYEERALAALVRHLDLDRARAVVELGCGTGRLAESLLRERLPANASYLGLDLSATMVDLARARLAEFAPRAQVRQTDGSPRIEAPDAAFDRFVSTYVLDLLSPGDIGAVLAEAHRLLEPGGLLGLVGLTVGERAAARLVTRLWEQLHRLRPLLVGGCRPLELRAFLSPAEWKVRHREVVAPWAIASEIVVAERI